MDQLHEVLRYHHYGYKAEQAYTAWIKRYIKFNQTRHLREMGRREIEAFLTHLAMDRKAQWSLTLLIFYVIRLDGFPTMKS